MKELVDGSTTGLADQRELSLRHLGSLLSLLKLLLGLAELGKIEGRNFFSFLNLFLIGLDLSLKFGGKLRHAISILAIFIGLEGKFLHLSLSLLVTLEVVSSAGLNASEFCLESH